jgi:hypothetical protein
MKLTPEIMKACYEFLATTEPFVKYTLPDADEVTFIVSRENGLFGWHKLSKGKHSIALVSKNLSHTCSIVRIMAHEMVHAALHENKCAGRSEHGKAFKALAAEVCKHHGFDPGMF